MKHDQPSAARRSGDHTSSRFPIGLAGVYLALASYLCAGAIFWPSIDGGEWYLMDMIYFPASYPVKLVRGVLTMLVPDAIWHEYPSARFPLYVGFDMVACLAVGTLWYYFLGKVLGRSASLLKRLIFR